MDKIQNLLNQIAIINEKNNEILDASGSRFNIFRVCGVNHYENTHSAIIAEFLSPKGSHGLKSEFLEAFIETIKSDFAEENFNCEKAKVVTESTIDQGRIDILIEDGLGHAIIIENKIYAEDQREQLDRYNTYAKEKKEYKSYQILYLTLFGKEASEQSKKEIDYKCISYKTTIISWLEKCVSIAVRHPMVRETINQYINHLKQLTNQGMDKQQKKEITEILSKTENLRAAQIIHRNYTATFNYLIEKHFNPQMEEFAKQKGLEYHYEQSTEQYVIFNFSKPSWQGKYFIRFTYESSRNCCLYGLGNVKPYRISEENKNSLAELLKESGVTSPKKNDVWPFYAFFPYLSLDTWEKDIIESQNFLEDCTEKVENLLKAMEKLQL